jgi:hypothetical protein
MHRLLAALGLTLALATLGLVLAQTGPPACAGISVTVECRYLPEVLGGREGAATDPPTATATATATPTSTPSAVATPTSTTPVVEVRCYTQTFVYPVGIPASALGANDFIPPTDSSELAQYRLIGSGPYATHYSRRLYVSAATTGSLFHWLRWRAASASGSAPAYQAAFSADGTLDDGFDEAPWQAGTALGAEPAGYPFVPGALSPDDWLYGGSMSVVALDAELRPFLLEWKVLTLPVVDLVSGTGAEARAHIVRLGRFALTGYGRENGIEFLDLAYVDETPLVTCP